MEKSRLPPLSQKSSEFVRRLCEDLLEADPQIRDIMQFGSSVYAPDLALDIDLLITTQSKKDYGVYLDAVAAAIFI